MYTIEIVNIQPLTPILKSGCCSAAFGCSHFYFINRGCPIISKLNCNLEYVENFTTKRNYSQLCYDHKDHCFWAWSRKHKNYIYQLDMKLNEIDAIRLADNTHCRCRQIQSIAYCCCNDHLIINYGQFAMEFDKATRMEKKDCLRHGDNKMKFITCLGSHLACATSIQNCSGVSVFSFSNRLLAQLSLAADFTIDCIMPALCNEEDFYLLAHKNCHYAYVIHCRLLKYEKGCHDQCCSQPCHKDKEHLQCCENQGRQPHCCKDECCKCRHHPDKGQSCSDLMESVALIETALAHILNAEGEKIQKILGKADNVGDILACNQSVKETVTKITHLEHVLVSKLELINELCKDCSDPEAF